MDMRVRPEFELLDAQYWRLRNDKDLDQEILKNIRDNIRLCEHVAQTDIEERVIFRTKFWWNRRASVFGMGMSAEPKLLTAGPSVSNIALLTKGCTAEDRRFLHSLRISPDGIPQDEKEDEYEGRGNV